MDWRVEADRESASRTSKMKLGSRIIDELARRGELGAYIDYAGYRRLRQIDSFAELRSFFCEQGFRDPPASSDSVQIADWLREASDEFEIRSLPFWVLCDPLSWVTILPVWLFYRLKRRGGS